MTDAATAPTPLVRAATNRAAAWFSEPPWWLENMVRAILSEALERPGEEGEVATTPRRPAYPRDDYWASQTPQFREHTLTVLASAERAVAERERQRRGLAERRSSEMTAAVDRIRAALDGRAQMVAPENDMAFVQDIHAALGVLPK